MRAGKVSPSLSDGPCRQRGQVSPVLAILNELCSSLRPAAHGWQNIPVEGKTFSLVRSVAL